MRFIRVYRRNNSLRGVEAKVFLYHLIREFEDQGLPFAEGIVYLLTGLL